MWKKGRSRPSGGKVGEEHHQAVLNDKKVRDIRKSTKTSDDLAKKYKCTRQNIIAIRNRETWKHIKP